MPLDLWTDPLLYQGGSDAFLAPRQPISMADEGFGIDFEGEVAVIVNDVAMGADRAAAAAAKSAPSKFGPRSATNSDPDSSVRLSLETTP